MKKLKWIALGWVLRSVVAMVAERQADPFRMPPVPDDPFGLDG